MTGHEAAALLGVSRRTVYRWIDEGRLPYPLTRETFPTQPGEASADHLPNQAGPANDAGEQVLLRNVYSRLAALYRAARG